MTTLDFAKSILLDEDKYGPNLAELAKALVEASSERDEARRIGLRMCRRAHELVTIAGTGEYGSINEARARLEGVQDVRDLATLLKDSEERARNAERLNETLQARIAALTEERDRALLYMASDDVSAVMKRVADVKAMAWHRSQQLGLSTDACAAHQRAELLAVLRILDGVSP